MPPVLTRARNSDEIRNDGLKPIAVTCDFKAKQITSDGKHPAYDLKRCFDIAWKAGFRGPWAIEHANADTRKMFAEFKMLRDSIRRWTAEAKEKP